ncbi:MAG: sigma-70 family RNA polymerase sigma factor [Symploca sp. SIO1A3]|nr:sigma-70 family RNA polymerase sigma factor [Symploca sp. SIO1A3]
MPNIVSLFSQFIRGFPETGDRSTPGWQSEPKLRGNMQRLLESDPEATEEFWARYFLKVLRGELGVEECGGKGYAQGHLSAYLQLTCYHVALNLSRQYSSVDVFRQLYSYQDYFQKANLLASDPVELLRNFRLELFFSIRGYAWRRLKGLVSNQIRREHPPQNWGNYSDWGLLRNTCRTELQRALEGRINQEGVNQHLLAWQCFRYIYTPKYNTGSPHLTSPHDEELQQIVQYYNQRGLALPEPGVAVDKIRIEQMLKACISAVRDWRTVSFSYPDADTNTLGLASDSGWEKISQDIYRYEPNQPLARLEQEDQNNQIDAILTAAFEQLSPHQQSLLRLWKYGLAANQQEIGQVFNVPQCNISRQLRPYKRSLLKAFAQGCRESFDIELSNEVIAQLDAPLEEWLENHCQKFFYSLLESIVPFISSEERRILQLCYCQNWSTEQIGAELEIPIEQVAPQVTKLKQVFLTNFTINLANNLGINPDALAPIAHRIDAFVETWLHTTACPLY